MVDYKDIATNEDAQAWIESTLCYLDMLGIRDFEDTVFINGIIGKLEIHRQRDDVYTYLIIENSEIDTFELCQDRIRLWFIDCHIKKLILSEEIGKFLFKVSQHNKIDYMVIKDAFALRNLQVYARRAIQVDRLDIYYNDGSVFLKDRLLIITGSIISSSLNIYVPAKSIRLTRMNEERFRKSTLNKLKELIQDSFNIEEVSIRDGKVNIHYIDKNRIEHDGCFSLKEEIGQTVLEEFKYNILYDIEYSGVVDKIKFTMEIRD